jgi:hypothetical protein
MSSLPPLPDVANTDPSSCILDSFRTAIAKRVSEALSPLTLEQAYSGVDYGKKGVDFTVALPRFRLPGKVDDLASKVVGKVSQANRSCGSSCMKDSARIFVRYFSVFMQKWNEYTEDQHLTAC